MIKNIMKNIGTKDVNKALEKYKTDAKNMTTEQLGYYVEDLKNGTGNIGKENLEERIKIYGDELEARNGKKDKAYVDYNDEIAQIYTDELRARNIPSELNKEQRKKWEEKAAKPEETIASLENFIASMSKPEAKANPHADEIVEIYKKELEKRKEDPKYKPEIMYEN
ncbi:MAG: hypothetical protein J6S67_20375 [Methanobrevibacter sp.]|nr:hypothetical protein [Clostridia bacterium]MBO7734929.1 hypothetical protein [Methanobrevibacter sp.]